MTKAGKLGDKIWKLEPGYVAAYTENPETWKKLSRWKGVEVMAEYFYRDTKQAVQFKAPVEKRKQIENTLNF